ncbi:MAG: EAL and HDOD domain-containing protein [Campylobacterales bacterium]
MTNALIGRQPILNKSGDIVAYELLFRSGSTNYATVTDNTLATASVLLNALNSIGLDRLIGSKKAFINVDKEFLMSSALEGLPQDRFVVEILETVIVDDEIVARMDALKANGFTFAIDDLDMNSEQLENFKPIMDFTSILKIDLMAAGGMEGVKSKISCFDKTKFKFLAEKVETEAEFEACKALGFDYYQGYFFEKPTIVEGKKIDSSKATVVKLLRMIQGGSELAEVSDEISKSPELSINLLKYINSAGSGVKCEVSSIGQAVSFLGRLPLSQWLMLFLYAGAENKFANPLMESAILRANIMSCFAKKLKKDKSMIDKAYLTGLLSFFDAIMQIPVEKIKDEIALDAEILEAITTRQNMLGKLLQIAVIIEKGDWAKIEFISKKLGISIVEITDMLGGCYTSIYK